MRELSWVFQRELRSHDSDVRDRATFECLYSLVAKLTEYDKNLNRLMGELEEAVDRLLTENQETTTEEKPEPETETERKTGAEENLETITYVKFIQYESLKRRRRY